MKSVPIPFQTTEWAKIPVTEHAGETGVAFWRTQQYGGLRIRMVEYSANYKADHWCALGHILLCLKGTLITELDNGTKFTLTEGMSYQVSDNLSRHRSITKEGATLFIVDGDFLKTSTNGTRVLGLF